MYNEVILVGYATKIESKYAQNSGLAVTSFLLTTTEKFTRNQQIMTRSEHHRVSAFGSVAESTHPEEGNVVFVSGRLRTRKYTDREGRDRYITEVTANRVVVLFPPQDIIDGVPIPKHWTPPETDEPPRPTEVDEVPF